MSYLCYSCGYQSKYKTNLRAHMKTHTGEIPYAYKTFDRWSTTAGADLRSHMMSHFEDKPYEFGSFDFGGERTGDFGKHYHTGRKSHKCGLCDYKTDRVDNLKAHIKTHSVAEEKDECELCDNSADGQKTHKRTHTRETACRSCQCNGTSGWTSRMKNHTVENRSCGICDHSSSSLSSSHLKKHVATLVKRLLKGYIGEKSCACELCDYSLNQTEHLGTLVRARNVGKPHACRSCDFGCTTALRRIKRTHSDENPYACKLCDDNSCINQTGDLSMHQRTLTREKPGDCKLCEYESSASSCGSREYRCIRVGDLKKRTKTRSKKKPRKVGSVDYRFNPNGQFIPPNMPPYFDGFPGYPWYPAGDTMMKTRTKVHAGDPLPYAVVLVTGDGPQW